jgi:5-methylthioadenosine/S-adenosylhomocysteine deaminase
VIVYLDSLGALGPRTLLAHCVQISADDAQTFQRTGAAIVHCPKSNAKLGNGVAPLSHLVRCTEDREAETETPGGRAVSRHARARLGIGTDGAASNNGLDLIEDLRFGILLQRAARRRADRPTAKDMVELATIGGARALGMEREIGTLEPGKAADVTAVGLRRPGAFPAYDPYSAVVYSCGARDVLLTVVAGSIVSESPRIRSRRVGNARRRVLDIAERLRNEWTRNGRKRAETPTGGSQS